MLASDNHLLPVPKNCMSVLQFVVSTEDFACFLLFLEMPIKASAETDEHSRHQTSSEAKPSNPLSRHRESKSTHGVINANSSPTTTLCRIEYL